MEEDDDLSPSTADLLQTLISPLSNSSAKLSNQSRALPSGKDFHFFNNFPDFKLPAMQISAKAESSLQTLASSKALFGSKTQPPLPSDLDDSYDWLVNVNDELMERFSVSMDEFKSSREKKEEKVGSLANMEEGGFQLVYGKNRSRKKGDEVGSAEGSSAGVRAGLKERKVAESRPRVPFHIPSIPRPQDQFNILVNNVNLPFEHVWLETSEDGNRVIHPLEKLSVLDFVDRSIKESEMVEPLPLESTPFKLVEGVKELKELAAKLRDAGEFAVDLEHNQYRSFQGLTCLMQISTRTEDFIVDTLKLRVHIGPYLREVFKDPSKKKVMHGADHDIEWLQRDFGIYVCNLFDTGQASRVLQLERNSLEYLLRHFCGVNADKEYQNAEWRLRPLPSEMIKYAREDTHYLLHIYDLMRQRLLSESTDCTDLLLEVYKRSYDICIRLYQKELLTDTSFLYIYGLQEADFDSKQLAIIAGLHEWRDKVGRDEDESTGYILPNKTLLEIGKQMPVSSGKLRQLLKSNHSYVARHLNTVVRIIRSSIENSSAFEIITEQLKQARLESTKQNKEEADYNSEPMAVTDDPMDSMASQRGVSDVIASNAGIMRTSVDSAAAIKPANTQTISDQIVSADRCQQDDKLQSISSTKIGGSFGILGAAATTEKEGINVGKTAPLNSTTNASIASVQISKKQSSAFGALLGNSASRRKLNPDKGGIGDQNTNVNKVELIKSSVSLPFLSFSCGGNLSAPDFGDSSKHFESQTPEQLPDQPSETTKLEDVILLENDETESPNSPSKSPMVNDDNNNGSCQPELEKEEEPSSLSDLSFSFQQCFQSISQRKGNSGKNQKQSQIPDPVVQVKPFDYAAARKNVEFGEFKKHVDGGENDKACSESGDKRKGSVMGRDNGKERAKGLRRHAFPSSGNRSTTYK